MEVLGLFLLGILAELVPVAIIIAVVLLVIKHAKKKSDEQREWDYKMGRAPEQIKCKILQSDKYHRFVNELDRMVREDCIAKIELHNKAVYATENPVCYKPNTSTGQWEFCSNGPIHTFFSVDPGERQWTDEEWRIVSEIVQEAIKSKCSDQLTRISPAEWIHKKPTKIIEVKNPY